jgi:hypothetical protein
MTTMTAVRTHRGWAAAAEDAARRLGAATAAGALLGLLVGGVGGRLAMLLIARLNPRATGLESDDGFTIGHFTSDSLNLLAVATVIGALGGGIYFLLRGVMLGPRWFQVLSISVGPAVVVGSMLVHTDGVDYTLLSPAPLSIAMFVAIPGVYAALLTVLAERWLAPGSRFMTTRRWVATAPLLLWLPIIPALGAIAVLLTTGEAVRRTRGGARLLAHPAGPWLVRTALAMVFVVCLVDLVEDVAILT